MDWRLKVQFLIWVAIFSEGALIFRNFRWDVCQISIYDFVLFEGKLKEYWLIFYTNIHISTKAFTKDYFEKLRESNIFSCFINNQSSLSFSPQLKSSIIYCYFYEFKKENYSSLFLISETKSLGLLLHFNQ